MSDPSAGNTSEDPLLREFMIHLGGAMIEAGDSVDKIQDTLDAAALAYHADHFDHFVLPTGLFVQSSGAGTTRPAPGPNRAEDLLAERFARGEIDEDEFRRRMALLREHR